DVAQDAGAAEGRPGAQAELLPPLDGDPTAEPAGDADVAEGVAKRHDLPVEAARGHGNAPEAGQSGRRLRSQAVRELDDAEVAAGGDHAVQPALQADLTHQVHLGDDLARAGEAAPARLDGGDAGDLAAGVRQGAAEVADRRLNDAGDAPIDGGDVPDDG